jgi:CDGSH-type Zn-finger protein
MDPEVRIEIQPNGPYLVHGGLPLTEMAPVHTFNGEPVDWHRLRDIAGSEEPYELCRCGESSEKPFCDGSHETNRFNGEETADRGPYLARATLAQGGGYELADDGPLCVSAGFCGTRTTDVWQLLEDADDPEVFSRLRDMTWACPSGRIVLRDDAGNDLEPTLEPGIAVVPGGPLWVRGRVVVTAADGSTWETRNRVTLCRCGASQNKPFCDRAHENIHFDER